jgi:hypothetical protein
MRLFSIVSIAAFLLVATSANGEQVRPDTQQPLTVGKTQPPVAVPVPPAPPGVGTPSLPGKGMPSPQSPAVGFAPIAYVAYQAATCYAQPTCQRPVRQRHGFFSKFFHHKRRGGQQCTSVASYQPMHTGYPMCGR